MPPHRFRTSALAALLATVTVVPAARPGEIFGYNPGTLDSHNRYDIFSGEYGFANPVRNVTPVFMGKGYNLSGLGYGRTADQAAVLITPRHFLMAAHVAQGGNVPTQVRFIGNDNVLRTYAVASTRLLATGTFNGTTIPNQTSDVLLGTLVNPIPAGHAIAPFLIASDPGVNYAIAGVSNKAFTDKPILPSGINFGYGNPFANNVVSPVLGKNNFKQGPYRDQDDSTHSTVVFDYDYTSIFGEFRSQVGDSGFPTFLPVGDKLALIGMHYDVTPPVTGTTSLDSFLPYYIPAINAAIGPTYSVGVAPIPEPSSVFLVSLGLLAYVRRRRRTL